MSNSTQPVSQPPAVAWSWTHLLVFLMLLNGHPKDTESKFDERVGETILGVAAAFVFGWAVPVLRARRAG